MYLLDTNILSFAGRGETNVLNKLAQHWNTTFWCDVSLAEFEYGYAVIADTNQDRAAKLRESNEDITRNLPKIEVSSQAFTTFGQLKFELKKNTIEDLDKLIAAVALAHNLVLVTDNTKHFDRVPNLKLENWKMP
jgi:tRNA(fMet)-specific endonuclease VapC